MTVIEYLMFCMLAATLSSMAVAPWFIYKRQGETNAVLLVLLEQTGYFEEDEDEPPAQQRPKIVNFVLPDHLTNR